MRIAVLLLVAGCGAEGSCLVLPADCVPQYDPVFDEIWDNTLSVSCALSGCHGPDDRSGGLSLGDNPDNAFDALQRYITPGDAPCSRLMKHLEPTGGRSQMPPGGALLDEERCVVRTWINDGAVR